MLRELVSVDFKSSIYKWSRTNKNKNSFFPLEMSAFLMIDSSHSPLPLALKKRPVKPNKRLGAQLKVYAKCDICSVIPLIARNMNWQSRDLN